MKYFVVIVLLVACLAYALYKPLPSSIDQQWTVGSFVFIFDSTLKLSLFADRIGLGSWWNIMRTSVDALAYLITKYPPDGMIITDEVFDGVPVRIYRPPVADGKGEMTGAIIYFHGGGFVWGSVASYQGTTMGLAMRIGVPVISVEYRRAPEVPYPGPFDDCVSATLYFLRRAADYNVDQQRVAVMGDSAGGNLAAAVALRLTQLPLSAKPVTQVLVYPTLQAFDFQLPAILQNDGKMFLTKEEMVLHYLTYMGETYDLMEALLANNHTASGMKADFAHVFDVQLLPERYRPKHHPKRTVNGQPEVVERMRKYLLDPFFSPLMAPPELIRGLPDTLVLTAGYDPLRDDGILYARKLEAEGVGVQLADYPDAYHPFLYQFEGPFATKLAVRAFDEIVNYIKTKLSSKYKKGDQGRERG